MSTSSREYSPDWLRNQAPPTTSIFTLSSSSDSILGGDPLSEEDEDDQLPISSVIKIPAQVKSPGRKVAKRKTPEKPTKSEEPMSDSEYQLSDHETSQHPKEDDKDNDDDDDDDDGDDDDADDDDDDLDFLEESSRKGASKSKLKSPKKKVKLEDPVPTETKGKSVSDFVDESSRKGASKSKSPNKKVKLEDTVPTETKGKSVTKQENDGDVKEVLEKETTEKQTGPYISSSRLPLMLSDKIQRSKALVECEGDSIDLSGDLGSVGRVVISDSPSGNQDILLDLKGTIYKTSIIPSRTFCVVSFGPSEAKIEAIMNDFIQLKPQSNVYEAETMMEGTLEGFSFDSEDENDNHPIRQTDENEGGGDDPQTNGKVKGKGKGKGKGNAEKTSGTARKKGKASAKKPAKTVKRKAPASKKTKAKK